MVEVEITIRMTIKQEEAIRRLFKKYHWQILVVSRKEIENVAKGKIALASASSLESGCGVKGMVEESQHVSQNSNLHGLGMERATQQGKGRCKQKRHTKPVRRKEGIADGMANKDIPIMSENLEDSGGESEASAEEADLDDPSDDECGRKKRPRDDSVPYQLEEMETSGPVQCKICGKFFISQTFLLAHNQVHDNHETLTCSVCLRIFKNKRLLKCHQLVHFDLRRYKCPSCDRAFKRVDHLRRHQKCKHPDIESTKQTQYDCEICDQVFVHEGNLENHKKIHHA